MYITCNTLSLKSGLINELRNVNIPTIWIFYHLAINGKNKCRLLRPWKDVHFWKCCFCDYAPWEMCQNTMPVKSSRNSLDELNYVCFSVLVLRKVRENSWNLITFSLLLEKPNYKNPRRFLYRVKHTKFVLILKCYTVSLSYLQRNFI